MNETLTRDLVETFLKNCHAFKTADFAAIDDDAAELLGSRVDALPGYCPPGLNLSGLKTLSEAAATSLARVARPLNLSGLREIPDPLLAILVGRKGGLNLSGLTDLSDEAAALLAKHQGWLQLEGLARLGNSPAHLALAKRLAKESGVTLSRLTDLSDEAAALLAKRSGGGWLDLSGLTRLSDAAAAALAQNKGWLRLEGLTELSDTAADALATKKRTLDLSPVAAAAVRRARERAAAPGSLPPPLPPQRLTFHDTPGHGYLAVPLRLLRALNLTRVISAYSFVGATDSGEEIVYCEEDRDAGIVLDTLKRRGTEVTVETVDEEDGEGDARWTDRFEAYDRDR